MTKRKVLYLTNIPSPYMVGYLNELGRYCQLFAVFEKNADSSRPDSWKHTLNDELTFKFVILSGVSVSSKLYGDNHGYAPDDKAFSMKVIKYISDDYDMIIVGNPCTPTGIIAELYMQFKHISYSIQSEGGFPGSGRGLKERFKYRLMSRANLYFSTCKIDDEYFKMYGAIEERIRRYNFTSMHKRDIPENRITLEERVEYKKKLGVEDSLLIITVGRSVQVKGFDILLKSFSELKESADKDIVSKCKLCLIGAEEIPEYTEIITDKIRDSISFIDNIPFEQLKDYYRAADLFVLPTRGDTWGLVINEAMAFSLPIITTDKCVAANALIENGIGGIIFPVEEVHTLTDAMTELLKNEDKRVEMGRANHRAILKNTLEQMGITMSEHIEDYCRNKE